MDIPQKFILTNLPTHITSTFAHLPEFSEKAGAIYFVTDEKGVPMGIALSGEDKRVRFYSFMREPTAEDMVFEAIPGIKADNVQEALEAVYNTAKIPGSPGASAYVHIRWRTSATPSTLLTTPSDYIGIVSTNSATAPATYSGYSWFKYKGEQGAPGTPGAGLTDDDLMLAKGFDNLQNWKGFTLTFSTTATTITKEYKKGTVLRARRVSDFTTAGTLKITETFFKSDGTTILSEVVQNTNLSTLGGAIT